MSARTGVEVTVSFRGGYIEWIAKCPPLAGLLNEFLGGGRVAGLLDELDAATQDGKLEYGLGGNVHWMEIREGRVRFYHEYIMADGSDYQEEAEHESCEIALDDFLTLARASVGTFKSQPDQITLHVDCNSARCG